jgi:glycosyltransferase involved in cell wall biosynthesis
MSGSSPIAQHPATDKTSSPLVSVVIPTYNGGPFIAQAIRSALDQTMGSLEVVIVDDASTDDTLEIVGRIADHRVRVLTSEGNVGAGANWNRAVRAAQGRYVKLLCQDDVLERTCIERQVATLRGEGGATTKLVCARRRIIDECGRTLTQRGFPRRVSGAVPGPVAAKLVIRSGGNLIGEPSAVLFRKEDALRVGLFNESEEYVIDLDMWFRLLAVGALHVIAEPLASFRISTGSWSVALAGEQTRQYCALAHRVSHDPRLAVPRRDVVMGCVAARLLGVARRILYAQARHRAKAAESDASRTS